MSEIALACSLLLGVDQASEVVWTECLLRACVEAVIPREDWKKEVAFQVCRQDKCCRTADYLGGAYYDAVVVGEIRFHLESRAWTVEQRLWLATHGAEGVVPSAPKRVNLADLVRKIGGELPGLVKRGGPFAR